MAQAAQFPGDILVLGNVVYTGLLVGPGGGISRSVFSIDSTQSYQLEWTKFRKHDAYDTNLSATPATVYLGLVGGTFATGVPSLQTGDLKNAGSTTRYARIAFQLPPEYVAGTSLTLRLHAGAITTVASSAMTVDVECYKSGKEFLVSGSDLCTTAPVTCNSSTLADKDFSITGTGLVAGDELDIRLAILVNDSGTVSVVAGCIGRAELLLSIRG